MDEKEKEFDDIVKRCLSGQASEAELDLLEKWLDARAMKDPLSDLSVSELSSVKMSIFRKISSRKKEGRKVPFRLTLDYHRTAFYRIAAAVVFLVACTYSVWRLALPQAPNKVAMVQEVSSDGFTKKLILSDSTIVWLKGNSSILYPEEFQGAMRNVKLTGEALFEVSRNPHRPFIIECGELVTEVLGTSFNIRSNKTGIEVIVLTGKVMLSPKDQNQRLILYPKEKAVYNEMYNKIEKVIVNEAEVEAMTVDTEYAMSFSATRLEEIMGRIEDKFDVRFALSDMALNNCTITADFTGQSLDRTISMISQTLQIEYEIRSGLVILRGRGCE